MQGPMPMQGRVGHDYHVQELWCKVPHSRDAREMWPEADAIAAVTKTDISSLGNLQSFVELQTT